MTRTMRRCALTLLAMGRDAWAFVAAIHFVVAVQHGLRVPMLGSPSTRVCRDALSRRPRGGVERCVLVGSMLPSIALLARWGSTQMPDLKA